MILNAQHLARIGLHQLLVVRGHDDQCALFLTDAMQQGCYLHASLSIKVARWFVCQYNLWMIQTARAITTRCCSPPDNSLGSL